MGRLSGTSAVLREYSPCPKGELVTINLKASNDGARITVRDVLVDAFTAIDHVMLAHGYVPEKHHTGGYNCRKITGGSGWSIHASAAAGDYNWQRNPYGKRLVTDMPAAMVADIKAIQTNDGVHVFRWGGDYTSVKDAMHYECLADRKSIATGINPATVAGVGFKPSPGTSGANGSNTRPTVRLTKPFMRGPAVTKVQELLKECNHDIGVDGVFGPISESHIRIFQAYRGLEPDGIVGPKTWARLEKDAKVGK